MQTLTPIEITGQFRYEVLSAVSTDGQWKYQRDYNIGWSTIHVPSGRRYWTTSLDAARADTADGTANQVLAIGHEPPAGKPMVKGEHTAITAHLTPRDLEKMLKVALVADGIPELVAEVRARIGLSPSWRMSGTSLGKALGAVYGTAPDVWLAALRAVRPDLVPPHLTQETQTA